RLELEFNRLTGKTPKQPLRFNRQINLKASDGEQWSALLRYFCEQIAHASQMGWIKTKLAEETLMRHLLCAQSITLQEHLLGDDAPMPQGLQRARQYMEAHLHEEISLADIARQSGTSVRNLSRMCQAQYGTSPMQLLRNMRLDKIRHELSHASVDTNVSEIAMSWGYTHLGRFAAAYRQRFGEAPHETLEKNRQ